MAANMDRSLDEILAEKRKDRPRNNNRRGGGGRDRGDRGGDRGGDRDYERPPRRNERTEYPRDGIRKSYRDEPRNFDSEWVHDRYEDDHRSGRSAPRRRRESPEIDSTTSKIRVENLHYELNEEDLDGLFKRIGPVTRLVLVYDRAGRSEGVAYVTYEEPADARAAIREFDGANANGQPIRLSLVGNGRGGRGNSNRNPFDTAVMPGRPLSERVSAPRGRSRSPGRYQDSDDAADRGIDRYVPGGRGGNRNRSPLPRRRGGGRRAGARHETGGDRGQAEGGRGGNRRPKKTQEELDAEMADYFTANNADSNAAPAAPAATNGAAADDIDMIE